MMPSPHPITIPKMSQTPSDKKRISTHPNTLTLAPTLAPTLSLTSHCHSHLHALSLMPRRAFATHVFEGVLLLFFKSFSCKSPFLFIFYLQTLPPSLILLSYLSFFSLKDVPAPSDVHHENCAATSRSPPSTDGYPAHLWLSGAAPGDPGFSVQAHEFLNHAAPWKPPVLGSVEWLPQQRNVALLLLCYAAMLYYARVSYAMLYYTMLCHAMRCLSYATLRSAMLCYAMLCNAAQSNASAML